METVEYIIQSWDVEHGNEIVESMRRRGYCLVNVNDHKYFPDAKGGYVYGTKYTFRASGIGAN